MTLALLLGLLGGYLAGSVPFGPILAAAHGVDLRRVGSGNIGATNAARALGKGWGAVVMLLDAAKAAVPIWLFLRLSPDFGETARQWVAVAIGTGAVLGHLFPFTLGFRGGKGVSTALGAFLPLCPAAAFLGALTWGVAITVFRISSVGSLCAVALFPLWLVLLHAPLPQLCFSGLLMVLIVLRHRGNIQRLLRRQEPRV